MNCYNQEYQMFCAALPNGFPSCKAVDKMRHSSVLSPWDNFGEMTLLSQVFEERELFLQKKMIKFYSRGFSMYPCIQKGDILHVESKRVDDINVGEIAVYRRFGNLFGHRVVSTDMHQSKRYVVTKPDIVSYGNDGPSFEQDIVGVVVRIERKGKILEPLQKEHTAIQKIKIRTVLFFAYGKSRLLSSFIPLICRVQTFKAYRVIAQFLSFTTRKKIHFSIQVPLRISGANRFEKKISEQELVDINRTVGKETMIAWKIVLDVDGQPAAWLSFIYRPEKCLFPGWWLAKAHIKMKYRGSDVEKKLFTHVAQLLKTSKINRIYIGTLRDRYMAKRILQIRFSYTTFITKKPLPKENKDNNAAVLKVGMEAIS